MNFCTLFNSYYLSRGLALYYSLQRCAKDFHFFIFAFDNPTYEILTTLNLPQVTVIALNEFETADLLKVKKQRSIGEYCWTCTPAIILHCIEKYQLSEVCYLDADLYFWQDPQLLLNEAVDASVMITEHRYTAEYDHAAVSGRYCVQFMYFKNDVNGLGALKWWRAACIDWCFDRVEEGKFGDQKYLDDWTTRFCGVRVLEHLGGGVAPWNVQQYKILNASLLQMEEITSQKQFELVFYHFHALKFVNDSIDFGGYKLSLEIKHAIYAPYVRELVAIEKKLLQRTDLPMISTLNIHGKSFKEKSLKDILRNIKKRVQGVYNCVPKQEFEH